MFWHSFKYSIKTTLRDKTQMFWSFIFIVLLGTLFYSTFGNAYEASELVYEIKVIAYIEDIEVQENVSTIIETVPADDEGEKKLLNIIYADTMEEAEKLFDENSYAGLFYSENSELKLIVKETGIEESILSSVVSQYHQIITVMKEVSNQPAEVQLGAILKLMGEGNENKEITLTDASMDVFATYFYNLLAMACFMSCSAGVTFSIKNQANLSTLGARKCMGGTNGFGVTFGGLFANWLLLSIVTVVAFAYLLILGVNFGNKIPAVILAIFVGNLVGISAGYFVGSIGNLSKGIKDTFSVMFAVLTGFFAGLMIMDMRMIIETACPVINDINPAIWLSDAFYALVCYDTYDRYWGNMFIMLVFSVVCIIGGVIMGRRKQYASI